MKKIGLMLVLALSNASLSETANAAANYRQHAIDRPVPYWTGEVGPYHQDILRGGGVTGPIAPDANGG